MTNKNKKLLKSQKILKKCLNNKTLKMRNKKLNWLKIKTKFNR